MEENDTYQKPQPKMLVASSLTSRARELLCNDREIHMRVIMKAKLSTFEDFTQYKKTS